MTDQLPPPPALPEAVFEGWTGVYRWGSAWARGRWLANASLVFDFSTLTIRSKRRQVEADRDHVRAIRLCNIMIRTYVTVIDLDDRESDVFFWAETWLPIAPALEARGWPVIEQYVFGRYRSLADSTRRAGTATP